MTSQKDSRRWLFWVYSFDCLRYYIGLTITLFLAFWVVTFFFAYRGAFTPSTVSRVVQVLPSAICPFGSFRVSYSAAAQVSVMTPFLEGLVSAHTEDKAAVVVADALREVDVALDSVALGVVEHSAQDWHVLVALDREVDVLGAVREVLASPGEKAVIVSEEVVEVNLGLDLLALAVGEGGAEDVAVVDADVLGAVVERHGDGFGGCGLWFAVCGLRFVV